MIGTGGLNEWKWRGMMRGRSEADIDCEVVMLAMEGIRRKG